MLAGDEARLRLRIERLLEPLPSAAIPRTGAWIWLRAVFFTATLLLAVAFGNGFGDATVKALPGVVSLADSLPGGSTRSPRLTGSTIQFRASDVRAW